MAISVEQLSFAGGEWAPALWQRSDLDKYSTSVRLMKNAIALPHGPFLNRGGTKFVVECYDSTKKSRLIGFKFSVVQAYVLEFAHERIRIIKDGGIVVYSSGNGTDIVDSGSYKWTASASGTSEYYLEAAAGGDPSVSEPEKVYEDVGSADTDMPAGTLGSLAAGEWAYGDNDSLGFDTVYVRLSDGTDPDSKATGYLEAGYIVEVVTTYQEDELATIKKTQSADVLYIFHPNHPPRKLSRSAHDTWTLQTISFASSLSAPTGLSGTGTTNTYAVTAVNEDGEESVLSADQTNDIGSTLSWSSVSGAVRYNVYQKKNGIYGLLGTAGGTSFVPESGVDPDMTFAPPEAKTPFSSTGDYPGTGTFFQQRLVTARTDNQPDTIWGSVIGAFENMNRSNPVKDDDAFEFTIASQQVNEILWVVVFGDLLVGTSRAEWLLRAQEGKAAITPASPPNIKPQSYIGSADIQPLVINSTILFVERTGTRVRDLLYSLERDGYTGNDLSILANHLLTEQAYAVRWAYQQKPYGVIWVVRSDGALLGMTYHREHQVWGWHRHETEGEFEDIESLPAAALDQEDDVYAVVKREINGSTVRFIERFANRLPSDDVKDAFCVDCGLSLDSAISITGITATDPVVVTAPAHGFSNGDYVDISDVLGMTEVNSNQYLIANVTSNTFELQDRIDGTDIDGTGFTAYVSGGNARKAVLTVSGLDHLEGASVAILANGNVVTGKTVSGGSVTLPNRASRVHVGLPYDWAVETQEPVFSLQEGTIRDDLRSSVGAVVSLRNSRELFIGPDADNLTEVAFRTTEDYDDPIALFTGEKEVELFPADDLRHGRLYLKGTSPVPTEVTALTTRLQIGDE